MRPCPNKRCYVPDTQCRNGEATPADCPIWQKNASQAGDKSGPREDGNLTLLPWSGSALGLNDLAFLTSRGDPRVVGLVGAHNAGKTTMLAAWYQQIGRTGRVPAGHFAGSFSLEGWEAVAHALRWEGSLPRFPPHTSSGAGRAPGLLHLALRDSQGRLNDYLFADAPGEWFERWAVDHAANDAEGARWLFKHAHVIAIIADCEALSGPQRGSTRSAMIQLCRRVAAERQGRPVALIWSKADIKPSSTIKDAVRTAARLVIPDIVEFHVSITDFIVDDVSHGAGKSLSAVLEWALRPMSRGFEMPPVEIATQDCFFNYEARS